MTDYSAQLCSFSLELASSVLLCTPAVFASKNTVFLLALLTSQDTHTHTEGNKYHIDFLPRNPQGTPHGNEDDCMEGNPPHHARVRKGSGEESGEGGGKEGEEGSKNKKNDL